MISEFGRSPQFPQGHIGTDGVAAAFSGYICTTTTGTFLGRPEKEIFWNAYIGVVWRSNGSWVSFYGASGSWLFIAVWYMNRCRRKANHTMNNPGKNKDVLMNQLIRSHHCLTFMKTFVQRRSMKHSLLNPHKEIEASIMRLWFFTRCWLWYTFTTTSGTFLGCREKKIFGNEYMGMVWKSNGSWDGFGGLINLLGL